MKKMLCVFIGSWLIGCAVGFSQDEKPPKQPVTRVAYLANAGVTVATPEVGVLIDALFRDGLGQYAVPEPGTLAHIESAAAPFDEVRVVLVTHAHADHFDPISVARFMHSNTAANLVAPPQVVEAMRKGAPDFAAFEGRVKAVSPKGNEAVELTFGEIKIEAMKLSHGDGAGDIENLGYIVHIGGKRLLHVGDAELNDITRGPLLAHALRVDAACVPYWWLLDEAGRQFLHGEFLPKSTIAVHIPPAEAQKLEAEIRAKFNPVTVFHQSLSSKRL